MLIYRTKKKIDWVKKTIFGQKSLFHLVKVNRLGRNKYVRNFWEENIFEKLPRLFVQNLNIIQ